MKRYLLILTVFLGSIGVKAQSNNDAVAKQQVDSINRTLDRSVVSKQLNYLRKHYADDFVFTHGTGLVDSKESWIKNVADTSVHFVSREHDSTVVELHKDIAIITGKLTVHRNNPDKQTAYALRYVRVFAYRGKVWQMISHRTTAEWHLA